MYGVSVKNCCTGEFARDMGFCFNGSMCYQVFKFPAHL